MTGSIDSRLYGWLVLDKPVGISSAQALGVLKGSFRKGYGAVPKIGHAGTLDPFASGLLPVALGEATKTAQYITLTEKTYHFTVKFGVSMDTDDLTGKVIATSEIIPARAEIEAVLPAFRGAISQVPPQFSAIHVDGKRAYALARQEQVVVLAPRTVMVHDLQLLEQISADSYSFSMDCGKGTYVRAIARDIGAKLGTYAHVTALRRTRVGVFSVDHAISLENCKEIVHKQMLISQLVPIETALDDILVLRLDDMLARAFGHGQRILLTQCIPQNPSQLAQVPSDSDAIPVLVMANGLPLGLGRIEGGVVKPVRNLHCATPY